MFHHRMTPPPPPSISQLLNLTAMSHSLPFLLLLLHTFLQLSPIYSAPSLTSWSLDLHYGLVTLTFSETMQSKYFNSSTVVLQSGARRFNCTGSQTVPDCPAYSSATSYRLNANLYTNIYNATSLYISMASADYGAISLDDSFGTAASNTFLTLDQNCSLSETMEWAEGINDGAGMQAAAITADVLAPAFYSWSLDFDSGIMDINFGEPVNATSLIASNINFQEIENMGTNAAANIIALTGTNVTILTDNGSSQKINLGNVNMNKIKSLSPLATLTSKTYISFSQPAYKDMSGNDMSLAYVSIYDAKGTTSFTPDTTPPHLVSFDLNMNDNTLRLIFSETINTFQLEVDQITLQGERAERGGGGG